MIISFRDTATKKVFDGDFVKGIDLDAQLRGKEKLDLLNNAAAGLEALKVPPGNKLEALKGDRKGQHSIRINRQWRLCFIWKDGNAEEAEICDYH